MKEVRLILTVLRECGGRRNFHVSSGEKSAKHRKEEYHELGALLYARAAAGLGGCVTAEEIAAEPSVGLGGSLCFVRVVNQQATIS